MMSPLFIIFIMRLFVFDVDGTLVGRDKILRQEVINSINNLLNNGDVVAIASGRPYQGIIQYLNQFTSGNKFAICANGAEVCKENGEILNLSCLKLSDYYNFLNNHKNIFNCENANIYAYTEKEVGCFKLDKYIEVETNCNGAFTSFLFQDRTLSLDTPILKFMIASKKDLSSKFESEITESEKKSYQIVRTAPIYIEFINKNTDKSVGVEFLRKYLSIDKNNVFTFGDAGNDFKMIRDFVGIAMGNAIQECKDVAKFVTKNVDDLGVPYALINFINNK